MSEIQALTLHWVQSGSVPTQSNPAGRDHKREDADELELRIAGRRLADDEVDGALVGDRQSEVFRLAHADLAEVERGRRDDHARSRHAADVDGNADYWIRRAVEVEAVFIGG